MKRRIYVGTSGWLYKDWIGKFYPQNIKTAELLKFYSAHFTTVEVNSTFYRLMKAEYFKNWEKITPTGFVFSVKMNRSITQLKKLSLDEYSIGSLWSCIANPQSLKEKFAVMLVQLPPSFKCDHDRLKKFLIQIRKELKKVKYQPRFAFEFRDSSWINEETYRILEKHSSAIVVSHSNAFPFIEKMTADFCYIRFHGPGELFSSLYKEKEMEEWADKINKLPSKIKTVYAYFNNDVAAYAAINAKQLIEKLK